MQLQAVVRGVERVVVAFLLLRAQHGDLREHVFGPQTLVQVEGEELLMERQVGITPDRAGEVRITRLAEAEVKLRVLAVARARHRTQEPRQDHGLAVVVRDIFEEMHAGGAAGREIARENAERLGDKAFELGEFLGIGFGVDAVESADSPFDQFVRDGRVRGEHALLHDAVRGARDAAQEPLDLVRGLVAEHADLRHVDPQELFVLRAPAAHLPHKLVQELNILRVLPGPALRTFRRVVQERLDGVVVHTAVHLHQRVNAARGEDLSVAEAHGEDHAVGGGKDFFAEADLRGERFRKHRQEFAGEIRGERPVRGGLVEPGAGADPGGDVGDVDAERDLARLGRGLNGDGVVEIVRVRRVDRERVQGGKVFALDLQRRDLHRLHLVFGGIGRRQTELGGDGVQVVRHVARGTERTFHVAAELFRMVRAVVEQPHLHPVALLRVAGRGVHADGLRQVLVQRADLVQGIQASNHEFAVAARDRDNASDRTVFAFRVRRVAFVGDLLDLDRIAVQGVPGILARDEELDGRIAGDFHEAEPGGRSGEDAAVENPARSTGLLGLFFRFCHN